MFGASGPLVVYLTLRRGPRPVDVEVERPAGERYLGVDSQLDAAVRTLLGQIDGR